MKPADIGTEPALGTFIQIDAGGSAPEVLLLRQGPRLEQEMEVCRIHITVDHDFVLDKGGKGSRDGCLTGPSLPADNGKLFDFKRIHYALQFLVTLPVSRLGEQVQLSSDNFESPGVAP